MTIGPEQHDSPTFHGELIDRCAALEARLKDLEAQLEHTHRLAMLGTIVGSIAHEINNILTPVVSYASLAKMHPEDNALAAKALDRASSGASRAAAIATTILDLVRSPTESNAAPTADVAASVEQVLSCTGHRVGGGLGGDGERGGREGRGGQGDQGGQGGRGGRGERIEVVVEVDEACVAAIEPIALQQVLMNLVLNATHAMDGCCESGGASPSLRNAEHGADRSEAGGESGGEVGGKQVGGEAGHVVRGGMRSGRLTIRGSTWNMPTGEQRVQLDVADTGCGMDAATLGAVFEPFVSGAGTGAKTARQDGQLGTGLGLSTSRQLIERAGGSINVRSEVGVGTVFTIDLPSAAGVPVRNSA